METTEHKSFTDSEIYKNPRQAYDEVIAGLNLSEDLVQYFEELITAENPKDDKYQQIFEPLLQNLLDEGRNKEAGLVFNIHRTLTQFRGYGASDNASSVDVPACFGEDQEIPEKGLIVVDFFATRNFPEIVKICENRGIDLSRLRMCVPKGVLAAQLMLMNDDKRVEVETAFSKLSEDQFIFEDVAHNADLKVDGEVAIWFSPRTMPITPGLMAETEEATAQNYCSWFNEKVSNVISGGRIFANLAYSEDFTPLSVEVASSRRTLTKLTGISRGIAEKIAKLLVEDLNFKMIGKEEFNPLSVDPQIDHAKLATELHLIRAA
ncbi:hypothetical protein GF354_05865 [Candidatus Peregrinibacteria bacterium]|nr:hypothetical protein [Candidatus Peregrinibacteria bacterium]